MAEKNKSVMADEGSPLGKTKRVDAKGVSDISNAIAGYIIVEAESHDAAAKLFLNHPHFSIFPGDAVEIMPCNPMPTMEDIEVITISAFEWVPDFAQGQVRDLRARWALEEAGLPYQSRLLAQGDQDKPEYRALQPFGQVPIFEENGFVLFESGAIVLHIGERSEALLPKDAAARARATQWVIAALNSIEPLDHAGGADRLLLRPNEEWAKAPPPGALEVRAQAAERPFERTRRQALSRWR
jgi:hypothetical protein